MRMKDGRPNRSSNFASCVVGTIFVAFIIIIMLILFFSVFKAKDPKIIINAVQLPNFHVSSSSAADLNPNDGESTVNFTISVYLTVKNPNRGTFNYYDSSLELNYDGDQIGFMLLPAGKVMPQSSRFMAVTLSVQPFPAVASARNPDTVGVGVLAIHTKLKMAGRVRVLHFFTHHAQAYADCEILIASDDGSVRSFHCTGP